MSGCRLKSKRRIEIHFIEDPTDPVILHLFHFIEHTILYTMIIVIFMNRRNFFLPPLIPLA